MAGKPALQQHSADFQKLYQRYFNKLVNGLRRSYGAGPPDPEDVAQAAFEKLGRRETLTDISDPENYIWVAARNIILLEKRRQAVRNANASEIEMRFFGEQGDTFEPERILIAKDQLSLVMETLSRMPERRRQIFMLARVHGLTPAEAGQRCGVSRTAAVRHIAKATSAIAAALSPAEAAE
ncbi:MAG: RNA polymerase sigma factor [Pseudomonadota bacterium]